MSIKNKKVLLSTFFVICLLFISGCLEQKQSETSNGYSNNHYLHYEIGLKDTFSVNSSGGEYKLFDDAIKINVLPRAVNDSVEITVESISNPIDDPNLIMFSCFEFGPDGTTFKFPIDLIIDYNQHNLPQGVEETDIQIYVLNGDTWKVIEDSFANDIMNWAVASVSHFSKMGCAAAKPSTDEETDEDETDDESNDENNSAQIWFQPNIDIVQFYKRGPGCGIYDNYDQDEYDVIAVIWWDPVPYVQYYQFKFEFNGNQPKQFCPSCEFRDWGKSWCKLRDPWFPKEGYIYHLGHDSSLEGYMGVFDKTGEWGCGYLDGDEMKSVLIGRMWPEGKHGYDFFFVDDIVEDVEELSEYDKINLQNDMFSFVEDYIDKWDIWVRGITEIRE